MIGDLDAYDYIISIDLGSTFSGSCYTCTKNKDTIVHVTKWPHQETFEKTPSVCLYDITQEPPVMIKWGQAAVDHATLYPDDANTLLISEFKLKLFNLDAAAAAATTTTDSVVSYRTAAVDYLGAIHTYTLQQFLQNNPTANEAQIRYVLTIPATWVNKDSENLRQIAIEANVISASEPEAIQRARLAILSEAHAASLFCEREYCVTPASQLFNAQRYLVIDVGGATADLATYECTENEQGHCQLALESMGVCGSIILDQHMETYLKDQVFFGCADERLTKLLVEQFKTKIKHYFGEDGNDHNNYVPPTGEQDVGSDTADDAHLMAVMETRVPTDMTDFQQGDCDYDAFNDSYHSDDFMDDALDEEDDAFDSDDHANDQEDANSDFERVHGAEADQSDGEEMEEEYIYLSMPPNFKSLIEPLIIENLLLRRDLTTSNQIRISHAEIAKHVFDPVVNKVITLIRKQIKKSYTTIDTLFLLGGFGQSPYLQKKLHEEFITSTNSVQRIIVPENGYRASMRGGIHYGLDCARAIPEVYIKDKFGNTHRNRLLYNNYETLVAIEFNFDEMTAMYSIIELDDNGRLNRPELDLLIKNKLEWHKSSGSSSDGAIFNYHDSIIYKFHFDPSKFIEEYYSSLEDVLSFNQSTLLSNSNAELVSQQNIDNRIYSDFFINAFMEQLFVHIMTRRTINPFTTRYCASVSSTTTTTAPSGLHALADDTPRETLKRHLLSRMMQSTRLPNGLKVPLHDAVCDILDGYSTELLSPLLKKKVRQVGIYLDMLQEGDSEARFALNLHAKNTYYIRKCSLEHARGHEVCKIFVFDLTSAKLSSLYRTRRRPAPRSDLSPRPRVNVPATETQKRGRVQVCTMDKGVLFLHNEENYFQDLGFADVLNQEPETVLTGAVEIIELVTARNFPVHHLLAFLGTETDVLSSEHVRSYIKKHVDLSEPSKVHKIGDVFLEPDTNTVVFLEYQQASILMKSAIDHTIRRYKDKTFTTNQATELLLLPWIRRILVPVVMKAHSDAYERPEIHNSTAARKRVSYLVFPEQIIETKCQGRRQMFPGSNNRQTCAAYLFDALKQEILPLTLRGSLPSEIEMHAKTSDDEIYGHLGCIMDAVRMPKKQETIRIARRTYAVHFLKYFVQRPTKAAVAAAQDQSGQEDQEAETTGDASDEQENETEQKKTFLVEMNIDVQDHLTLYPLIRQDTDLVAECYTLNNNRYCIQDKCSVAAVLYVSDEMPASSEYYISNTSFKKLHRFIIPIEDPTQPVRVQCTPEDYSILFTVSQGNDYKADFRCNDLMYYC